ncbi:hypothetical protein [Actibacterium ureilyticum]|uniref:hypothetical protein n=1 Tax=Actibacterium ureilyticum TaxID=1590614 RepID=UPI001140D517|nr:hypothetical protein [Actibacterium ureilyticum]
MAGKDFERSVFVNCPFDAEFEPILQAILFCLVRYGLKPRIATERSDSSESRLAKIEELIWSSKFSIHDLSRTRSVSSNEFYRLNMPFELGIDYGCKRFGPAPVKHKHILVTAEKPYEYQAALSDLAGSDIAAHDGEYTTAIRKVRNWLVGIGGFGSDQASKVISEYEDFQEWFLEKRLDEGANEDDLLDTPTAELLDGMLLWFDSGMPRE